MEIVFLSFAGLVIAAGAVVAIGFFWWLYTSTSGTSYREIDGDEYDVE
jgi:hypothetical protein